MIGVLALQGAFLEHLAAFAALCVEAKEVRTPAELDECDALVIPGGESTAMALIAQRTGVWDALAAWVAARRPTWGTCAGMVLLAGAAQGGKAGGQALLGGVDVQVHRNYFGSQLASFEAPLELAPADGVLRHFARDAARGGAPRYTGVFIRAPAILAAGAGATPLAWVRAPRADAHVPLLPAAAAAAAASSSSSSSGASSTSTPDRVIVAVQQGPFLVTAFHPELTADHAWHALFVEQVEAATGKALRGAVPPPVGGSGGAPAALYADRSLTPGTSALSSFKNAGAGVVAPAAAAGTGSGRAGSAAPPGAPVLPQPVGLVGTDEGTCGHAKSHAIAHRVILYPPVAR